MSENAIDEMLWAKLTTCREALTGLRDDLMTVSKEDLENLPDDLKGKMLQGLDGLASSSSSWRMLGLILKFTTEKGRA